MRSPTKIVVAALTLVVVGGGLARADDPVVIQFDPQTHAFSSLLPFRTPFTLDVPAPLETLAVSVKFWVAKGGACSTENDPILLSAKLQAMAAGATEKHYQVTLPALHADTHYCVSSAISRLLTSSEQQLIVSIAADAADKVAGPAGAVLIDSIKKELQSRLGTLANARVKRRSANPKL